MSWVMQSWNRISVETIRTGMEKLILEPALGGSTEVQPPEKQEFQVASSVHQTAATAALQTLNEIAPGMAEAAEEEEEPDKPPAASSTAPVKPPPVKCLLCERPMRIG